MQQHSIGTFPNGARLSFIRLAVACEAKFVSPCSLRKVQDVARSSLFYSALAATIVVGIAAAQPASASPPANWDGLVQVRAKNVDLLYLRPGSDFRSYKAIILDPTEIAFDKNWKKDMNRSRPGLSRISDADVRGAIDEAQGKLRAIFEKRFSETGFPIVSAPAENALRVFVGVANVQVDAPDVTSAGRSRVYSRQAGRATLVIEVRDSLSGELLGRAVDHGVAGDNLMSWRTSTSNWADFEQMFDEWARISAKGFQRLLASPPPVAAQ